MAEFRIEKISQTTHAELRAIALNFEMVARRLSAITLGDLDYENAAHEALHSMRTDIEKIEIRILRMIGDIDKIVSDEDEDEDDNG